MNRKSLQNTATRSGRGIRGRGGGAGVKVGEVELLGDLQDASVVVVEEGHEAAMLVAKRGTVLEDGYNREQHLHLWHSTSTRPSWHALPAFMVFGRWVSSSRYDRWQQHASQREQLRLFSYLLTFQYHLSS